MKKFVLSIALLSAANVAFAQSSTATTVSPNASATTVTAPVAATKSGAKKWSGSVYASRVLSRVDAAAGTQVTAWGDMYAQVTRDIGKGQSVSIRPTWLVNQVDSARNTETTYFDTYLLYSNSNWLGSTFRTNVPTGDFSRKVGRHEVRHDFAVDMAKSGKFTLTYAQAARAYFYTGNSDGQRSWRLEGDLIGTYAFNDKINVFLAPKYESNWRNGGTGVKVDATTMNNPENLSGDYALELGSGITPVKGVTIEPSLSYSRDSDRRDAIDLFNDKDTSYELEVSISL